MRDLKNISVLIFVLLSGQLFAGPGLNQPAPDFTLMDSNGQEHSLSDYKGKIVVLEWFNYGCPFVGKHYNSGHMQKLQKTYTAKDVVWLSICSSAKGKQGYMATNEEINKKRAELGQKSTAYLIDSNGDVGRLYGAKTTPHMFIINKEGILIYEGAIDDTPSTNIDDIATAHNYVSDTLDKMLAGEKVEPFKTASYGCSVKY